MLLRGLTIKCIHISKRQSSFLKGVGILFIMTHNYFHKVLPVINENEFEFNDKYFWSFLRALDFNFFDFINSLNSYFGHYFVQIFIFLSGYGLAVSYFKKQLEFKFHHFIISRIKKIYPIFILGACLVIIYNYLFLGHGIGVGNIKRIILRLSVIVNWIPGKAFIVSGPYWFYSMIFQLYLIAPIIFKYFRKPKALLWVAVFAYTVIYVFNPFFVKVNASLYFNFIGNLPVFLLGVYLADNKPIFKGLMLFGTLFTAIVLFVLGQFSVAFWNLSQLSFIVIALPMFLCLEEIISNSNTVTKFNFVYFLGKKSMYLFAVNGFLRYPWVSYVAESKNNYQIYFFFVVFMIITIAVALVLEQVNKYIQSLIKTK